MRSPGPTRPSSALRIVVLPVPVPPETRNASRASSTARSNASPRWSTVPSARRAARSCVAGRSTRSDRQVPSAATGGSTAWRRTPMSASHPSTYGHASSSLRPAATASRCASLRTAASSVNRTAVRSRPRPRSTQTPAGPQTRTSVVRGSRNSSSSGPAPVNSWRRVRNAARTSRSDATPPDSARTAAATAAGSVSPPAAASRERTRSTRPTVGAVTTHSARLPG